LSSLLKDAREEAIETLDDVKNACSVAIDILNDLLTYEKLDSDLLTLDKTAVDAIEMSRKVYKTFAVPAKYAGIKFEFENLISNEIAVVDIDVVKLSQVARNLVSNALKFTPSGGSCRMVLSVDQSRKVFRMDVHDSGPGMTREQRGRLFKEVVQFNAKELQNGGGSGMGLFLSTRMVELHGGSIGVDMDKAQPGSIFYFELPLTDKVEANPKGTSFFTSCL
jgi:two-component system sensor histidine kinase/response regulator